MRPILWHFSNSPALSFTFIHPAILENTIISCSLQCPELVTLLQQNTNTGKISGNRLYCSQFWKLGNPRPRYPGVQVSGEGRVTQRGRERHVFGGNNSLHWAGAQAREKLWKASFLRTSSHSYGGSSQGISRYLRQCQETEGRERDTSYLSERPV